MITKMETACLRIKFTPLLQNIHKEDSKHCLEIVPEVTCIQNLDKIQWRKEENSIEYTIPMTYKIILRKKHVLKDNKEEVLDKIYHSCVDLLLPSSDTNFTGLGSGDVSRIVSDTFVLSKVTTDVEKCSILLKDRSPENKIDEPIDSITAHVQTEANYYTFFPDQLTNNEKFKRTNYKSRETAETQTIPEVFQNESHVIQVLNGDIVDYIIESVDKITNTEISSSVEVKTISDEEIGHKNTLNIDSKTKRELSLTPICSINTHDRSETARRNVSNTIGYVRYEPLKDFGSAAIIGKNTIKCDDLYFGAYKRNTKGIIYEAPKQYYNCCVNRPREHPEVRVANFVRIMEKEISPLKLMLCDIISKCSSLGFSWKKTEEKSIIYKSVSSREKQISTCMKNKKETNSNRVVYTVVFDG